MAQRSIISFLTHEAPTSPDGGAATLAQALDARVREGELIEKLSDHAVRCFACGHRCLVKPGRRGICKVRFNKDGTLYVPAGYVAALQCDPTEKKPFFHALPGSDTLTFGMLGCDFHCGYCQNWLTSQALRDDTAGVLPTDVTPDDLVRLAQREGAKLVGSSYNEPLITAEWAVDVFKVAKANGLKTAFISNGNATPQGLQDDGPRQHDARDAGAGVRDRGPRRTQVRLRRQPPRPGGPLGAHDLSRLRGPPRRALRVRHPSAARRARRPLPLLRAGDSGPLVLALVLVLQTAAGPPAVPPFPSSPAPRGPARFDAATFDPLVQAGIKRGAYPGAALAVGRADTVLFSRGYGHLTWSARSPAVDPDSTLYDLASVTKVVATTTALMLLVDRRRVRLDAPVATYVPEFDGPGTAAITVRQVLTHTSGLRPTLPLYREADSAAALRQGFAATPTAPPGTRVMYSDLNAILLGEIVRRASGRAGGGGGGGGEAGRGGGWQRAGGLPPPGPPTPCPPPRAPRGGAPPPPAPAPGPPR